ncbi:MAG: zf-HC2 domain-containing protein [Polyangiaceae bacterium]|nr:zf-HC2 domain-containing protein [Polyangiaceae bacterium]
MDCEKFDRVVLDLLYDELDELTTAAARRHMEHCARCRGIGAGLRATRGVGVLPSIEPPPDLRDRILAAERRAKRDLPLRRRFGRAVSILADYAMRPQVAMAALLLLMIGSSLLFVRARPGERDSVRVTDRGAQDLEREPVAAAPAAPLPALAEEPARREGRREAAEGAKAGTESGGEAAPGGGPDAYDDAMAAYRAGRWADAERKFDEVAASGGSNAASAALLAAQAARAGRGCSEAADRFARVHERHPGTSAGNDAAWNAAACFRTLGEVERARRAYRALTGVPGYAERAERALAELEGRSDAGAGEPVAIAKRAAPRAAPPAADTPAPSAGAAPPAQARDSKPAAVDGF